MSGLFTVHYPDTQERSSVVDHVIQASRARASAIGARSTFLNDADVADDPDCLAMPINMQDAVAKNDAASEATSAESVTETQVTRPAQDVLTVESLEAEESYSSLDDLDRSIGLQPKEPKQATITLKSLVQNKAPLVVTNRFILTSVSEPSQEKYQLFQTFDQDIIYFFDRNPHLYTYGGNLINAADTDSAAFSWRNKFQVLYETKLRGTKCVENNVHVVLEYEDVVREGYMLNCQMTEDARDPFNIPFNFLFFVTTQRNTPGSTNA